MLLHSLKFHNFRPFLGDQEINFSIPDNNDGRNVVVILGDNTHGKSTVVLSFIWCLYGDSRFNRPDDILNDKIKANMNEGDKETAFVEVAFEDGEYTYTMRRTQQFIKMPNGFVRSDPSVASLVYIDKNGETKKLGKQQNEVDLAIKSILPVDLSSFFFFEGEKDNEITRSDLGDSVRTLLGLNAYKKMREHLFGGNLATTPSPSSVMGYFLSKQNSESDSRANAEFEKMNKSLEIAKNLGKEISEIEENIKSYSSSIDEINESLRAAAPSKELQKRRDRIARDIKNEEDDLERSRKRLVKLFGESAFPFFLYPILDKAEETLNQMNISDKGIKGIEATAIRELLSRGECLCGTDLKPGSAAYKSVEKYIDFLPPKSVGTIISDMKEKIQANKDCAITFYGDFEECYKDIHKSMSRIDELEREDREVLADITKIGNIDTSDAEEKLSRYKQTLSRLNTDLRDKIRQKEHREAEAKTAENNFNMLKAKNERAKKYQTYYQYAKAIYNWVNANYSEKEKNMRDKLNSNVKTIFKNMYSGERDIEIDEKYNLQLTYRGRVVDTTGGLRVIQYFAYVGGLIQLAYDVMKERQASNHTGEEGLGEQYPLVLDAAFSHADENHTRNIAKELSEVTSQLVFAVMHKDWEIAKTGLTGKIGRIYELNKIDETEVKVVEVNV